MNRNSEKQIEQEMPGFGRFPSYIRIINQASAKAQLISEKIKNILNPDGSPKKGEKGEQKRLQKELDELRFRERRAFLLVLRDGGIMLGATALIGGAGAVVSSLLKDDKPEAQQTLLPPDQTPSKPESTDADKEADSDRLIEVAEKGWEKFAKRIEPLIAKVGDQKFRAQLSSPLQLMEMNKKNPNKNGPRFRREQLAKGNELTRMDNPYWFSFGSGSRLSSHNISAGFEPLGFTMLLSPNFDPDDDIDQLILYHELRHVAQTAYKKIKMTSQREFDEFVAFHEESAKLKQKRIVVNEEASAYGYEIDILNLLCGGELMQAAKDGRKVDMDIVKAKIKTKNVETLEMLVDFSQYYYPEGTTTGNFSKKFIDMIADAEAKRGSEVYIPMSGGGLKKIR